MKKFAFLILLWPLVAMGAVINREYSAVSGSELLKIMAALLLVIVLIVFLSWIIKRLNRVNIGLNSSMAILASTHLGMKEKMALVKVGERFLLVGIAAGSVTLLCDFGEKMPEGFSLDSKKNFADVFKNALRSS